MHFLARHTAVAALGLATLTSVAAAQSTVGNPLVARNTVDGRTGMIVVLPYAFGASAFGSNVSSYSLYSSVNPNGSITPLVVALTGGSFNVLGVGTARTVASGLNTFAFGLTSGSATVVGSTTRVGYYAPAGQIGVVDACVDTPTNDCSTASPSDIFSFTTADVATPTAGATYNVLDTYTRQYSIQFTAAATTTTPEPATFALLGGGLLLLGGVARRQTRRER